MLPISSDPVATLGRVVFGAAMAAFGLQNLVYGEGVFGLEPVPSWFPAPSIWAYVTGAALLGSGIGLMLGKKTRHAAAAAGVVLAIWVLLLQVPGLLQAWYAGGRWTTTFETVALCAAAWAAATSHTDSVAVGPAHRDRPWARPLARMAYAGSLPVFGVLHFIYRDYVASVIPAWIPNPAAWALITGLALIAAGAGMLTERWHWPAGLMVGAMFATWVLILHLPRALAAPGSRPEWISLIVALAMAGGAWIVAGLRTGHATEARVGRPS